MRVCPRCKKASVADWQAFRALRLRARFRCPACRAALRQELRERRTASHALVVLGAVLGGVLLASALPRATTPGQQGALAAAALGLLLLTALGGLAVARAELAASHTVLDRSAGLLASVRGLFVTAALVLAALAASRVLRAASRPVLGVVAVPVVVGGAYEAVLLAAGWVLFRLRRGRAQAP